MAHCTRATASPRLTPSGTAVAAVASSRPGADACRRRCQQQPLRHAAHLRNHVRRLFLTLQLVWLLTHVGHRHHTARAVQYASSLVFQTSDYANDTCLVAGIVSIDKVNVTACPYYPLWAALVDAGAADPQRSADAVASQSWYTLTGARTALNYYFYQLLNDDTLFLMMSGCSIQVTIDTSVPPSYATNAFQRYVDSYALTMSATGSDGTVTGSDGGGGSSGSSGSGSGAVFTNISLPTAYFLWNQPRLHCLYNAPALMSYMVDHANSRASASTSSSSASPSTNNASVYPTCAAHMPSPADLTPDVDVDDAITMSSMQLASSVILKVFSFDTWYQLTQSPVPPTIVAGRPSAATAAFTASFDPDDAESYPLGPDPAKVCSAPALYTISLNPLLARASAWSLGSAADWLQSSVTLTHNYPSARVVAVVAQCSGVPLAFSVTVSFTNPSPYAGSGQHSSTSIIYFLFLVCYAILLVAFLAMIVPCRKRRQRPLDGGGAALAADSSATATAAAAAAAAATAASEDAAEDVELQERQPAQRGSTSARRSRRCTPSTTAGSSHVATAHDEPLHGERDSSTSDGTGAPQQQQQAMSAATAAAAAAAAAAKAKATQARESRSHRDGDDSPPDSSSLYSVHSNTSHTRSSASSPTCSSSSEEEEEVNNGDEAGAGRRRRRRGAAGGDAPYDGEGRHMRRSRDGASGRRRVATDASSSSSSSSSSASGSVDEERAAARRRRRARSRRHRAHHSGDEEEESISSTDTADADDSERERRRRHRRRRHRGRDGGRSPKRSASRRVEARSGGGVMTAARWLQHAVSRATAALRHRVLEPQRRWWAARHILVMYAPIQWLVLVLLALKCLLCVLFAALYSLLAGLLLAPSSLSSSLPLVCVIFDVAAQTLLIPLEMLVALGWGLAYTTPLMTNHIVIVSVATMAMFVIYVFSATCLADGLSMALTVNRYTKMLYGQRCLTVEYARSAFELVWRLHNVLRMALLSVWLSKTVVPADAAAMRRQRRERQRELRRLQRDVDASSGGDGGDSRELRRGSSHHRTASSSSSSSSSVSARSRSAAASATASTTLNMAATVSRVSAAPPPRLHYPGVSLSAMEVYLRYRGMWKPFAMLLVWPILLLSFALTFYEPEDYYMVVAFREMQVVYLLGFIILFLRTSTPVYC